MDFACSTDVNALSRQSCSPVLLVGLIQRHSYTDCNYTDVNETICWFGVTYLMPEQWRTQCLAQETNYR